MATRMHWSDATDFILANTVLLPMLARRLKFCPIALASYQAIRLKWRIRLIQEATKCQGAGVPVLKGIDKAAGRGSTHAGHSAADLHNPAADRPLSVHAVLPSIAPTRRGR